MSINTVRLKSTRPFPLHPCIVSGQAEDRDLRDPKATVFGQSLSGHREL